MNFANLHSSYAVSESHLYRASGQSTISVTKVHSRALLDKGELTRMCWNQGTGGQSIARLNVLIGIAKTQGRFS